MASRDLASWFERRVLPYLRGAFRELSYKANEECIVVFADKHCVRIDRRDAQDECAKDLAHAVCEQLNYLRQFPAPGGFVKGRKEKACPK